MALAAILPALIGAGASIGGGILARRSASKNQKTSRQTIDDLLSSLKGGGPFGDLFNTSRESFDRSFGDSARSQFRNQTAPQIQQSFIASGQQRGTGLDDTLTRAGVDMDQLLNQQFAGFQQQARDRQLSALSGIAGIGANEPQGQSFGQAAGGALGGFLSSDSFSRLLQQGFAPGQGANQADGPFTSNPGFRPARPGFSSDFEFNQFNRGR